MERDEHPVPDLTAGMDPAMRAHVARLAAWRAVPPEEQVRLCILAARPMPWHARAVSLVATLWRQWRHGGPRAGKGVRADRKAKCLACNRHDPERDACRHCGCGASGVFALAGLTLEAKRSLALAECPLGAWGRC